jgi:hypothetical protein
MIIDHIRDIKEFKELYDSRPMPIPYDYEWLIKNPCLYCFYDENDGSFKGFITIQREEGELTLSGVSVRKNMSNVIDAIVTVCEGFNEDMYSYTKVRPAIICLLKAGFKHLKDDKYVRYKNG